MDFSTAPFCVPSYLSLAPNHAPSFSRVLTRWDARTSERPETRRDVAGRVRRRHSPDSRQEQLADVMDGDRIPRLRKPINRKRTTGGYLRKLESMGFA